MENDLKYTYLHETHTMYQQDGELHLIDDTQCIVINCDTFFNDLPHIVNLVIKARQEQTNNTLKRLKETLLVDEYCREKLK